MYNFDDLVNIIEKLRGENGCPWDREQTHDSLKTNMIEEAYETLEAIDSGNGAVMADEMGDLLLQIVMHAQIGKENGEYNIDDVINAVCTKMIRRHPHVFGDVFCENSEQVLDNWEQIKKQEKSLESVTDSLLSVSSYLPSPMRAQKVQKKAAKVGFDFKNPTAALCKVYEEADEIKSALSGNQNTEEEIGDLLFAAVNVARLSGVNPEIALKNATEKFINRFSYVEKNAPRPLDKMSIEEMDKLWENSKKRNCKEDD